MNKLIYCCGCETKVEARLTDGSEIYPHRKDLYDLPFWKCDTCRNHVGCHHKTSNRTQPLGCIPTKEIKAKRQQIHRALDPLWKSKKIKRSHIYAKLTKALGFTYHTASLRSTEECDKVLTQLKAIKTELSQ